MLRLIVLWSSVIFLINAQILTTSSQIPNQTSLQTSSASLAIPPKTSASSTSTTPTTTSSLLPGPVGQPAATTAVAGGPTPYTYTTVQQGVTQVLTGVFTPTSPPTVLVTPTVMGTILDYSFWLTAYGPTQTSSAGARYILSTFSFSPMLVMLLGILGGGGMVYV